MREVGNAESYNTVNNEPIQQGVGGIENTPLTHENVDSGLPVLGEESLTISTVEGDGELLAAESSDGIESPGSTGRVASQTEGEVDETEESGGESGETEEGLAAGDIALSASSVLASAILINADSSDSKLSPVQELKNKFKRSDDGDNTGEPGLSSDLIDGRVGLDFQSDFGEWNLRKDGLTESFAASLARINEEGLGGGGHATLSTLLGKNLIEA